MVFAGEGYATPDMKKMVRKLDLSDRVRFMGLVSDRKKLQQLYACADLFLFPSVYDNSPLVMQEAAAFEVPSLVVRNSSAAEVIRDDVNGFLTDNDKEALASRINEIMDAGTLIRKVGAEARKSVFRPWETVMEEVYSNYADIIRKHRGLKMREKRT